MEVFQMNRIEAAELCGVTPRTISNYISKKRLRAEKISGDHGMECSISREALIEAGLLHDAGSRVDSTIETDEYFSTENSRVDMNDSMVDELENENEQLKTQLTRVATQYEGLKMFATEIQSSFNHTIKAKDDHIYALERERNRLEEELKNTRAEVQEWQVKAFGAVKEAYKPWWKRIIGK
jgi:predicted RNase H-like nuclease (RuvC/YqgF family)